MYPVGASNTADAEITVDGYSPSNSVDTWTLTEITDVASGVLFYDELTGQEITSAQREIALGEIIKFDELNLAVSVYSGASLDDIKEYQEAASWTLDYTTEKVELDYESFTGKQKGITSATCSVTMNGIEYELNLEITVITIHDGMYLLKMKDTNYLQISGAADDLGYGASGTGMEMQYLNSGAGKRWNIKSLGNGYYKIISADSGLALAVTSDNIYGLNAAIVQETYTGAANQQWSIKYDGAYIIKARSSEDLASNLVMSLPYDDLPDNGEYSGYQVKQGVYNAENGRWDLVRMLPTSGSELEYDEEHWSGWLKDRANCYSYALNNQVFSYDRVTIGQKQQPGEYAGEPIPESYSDYEVYGKDIVKAVIKDFEAFNLDHGKSLICKEIGKYDVCPEGTYKIALVVGYPGSGGFHWLKFWSHKNGFEPVRRTDYNNTMIVESDKSGMSMQAFTQFIAYFAVGSWHDEENVA